jgi:hypothetical protein
VLKSDTELMAMAGTSLDFIREEARRILAELGEEPHPALYKMLDSADDPLVRAAVSYSLKYNLKFPHRLEDVKALEKRRREVEIAMERLEEQIEGSLPKGRDLEGEDWIELLETVAGQLTTDVDETREWQDRLNSLPARLPFPAIFDTNEDLKWSKSERGRLQVQFNGLSKLGYEPFRVYCDRRQLRWFLRFHEDQETKRGAKNLHSSALFSLRSATLAWRGAEGDGEPWNQNRLYLYCTVDTRLWSEEGTGVVVEEKTEAVKAILERAKEKTELTPAQEAFINRKRSTQEKLNTSYNRPHQRLYEGDPSIEARLAISIDEPATLTVVDGEGRVLTRRNTRALLGENYRLLVRHRKEKQRQGHEGHKARTRGARVHSNESDLGEYLDKLLAKSIVEVAREYRVGVIRLPAVKDIRESVETEIKVRAEAAVPGYLEGQKKYAKQYRMNVHRWSYARLFGWITTKAMKLPIQVITDVVV